MNCIKLWIKCLVKYEKESIPGLIVIPHTLKFILIVAMIIIQ